MQTANAMTSRQQEIIEQSIELIARRGIQELTIRNLSREIGISDPAIYRHFASKTDILLGVLDLLERETLGRLAGGEPPSSAAEGGVREVLEAHFESLFTRLAAAPALSAVIFADEAFLNEEPLVRKVRDLMERTQAGIERLIERGQSTGELTREVSAGSLATMLVGAVRLLVRRRHIGGAAPDIAVEGKRLVRDFLALVCRE
jgi:TetR/AcrR family transcriptional regulator, fatty acid metabolism regulator protein